MEQATKLYFYEDLYARELDVTVESYGRDERFGPFVTLNRTLFHPHGGGQKGDRGVLLIQEELDSSIPKAISIIDTRGEKGGEVRHILAQELNYQVATLELPGAKAMLQLNWEFRWKQMRLHSTAHLIHIFMERRVGRSLPVPNVSDIQEDFGLNTYDTGIDMTEDDIGKAVEAMNSFLAEGHEIRTYPDPSSPGRRKWECDGTIIPCGGTHPKDTKEIGVITANFSTKKGKAKVTFRLAS